MVDRVVRRIVVSLGGVIGTYISGCGCGGGKSIVTGGLCVSGVGASDFFASVGDPVRGLLVAVASSVQGVLPCGAGVGALYDTSAEVEGWVAARLDDSLVALGWAAGRFFIVDRVIRRMAVIIVRGGGVTVLLINGCGCANG